MITRYVHKLTVPLGTSAEPTIRGTEDNLTTGVNWYDNDDIGFVSSETSNFMLRNGGVLELNSNITNAISVPLLVLNRKNTVSTAGLYSSIDFETNNTVPMLSLRAVTESATAHGFELRTVNANIFNPLSAIKALSNNKVGINVQTPQNKFQISDEGDTLHASLIDTNSIQTITSSQLNGATLTLISSNVENTTRGAIKGIKTKGTVLTPIIVGTNDFTLSLLGAGYDGVAALTTAGIHLQLMGTPSVGVIPQGIVFETGTTNARIERARFMPDGKLGIGTTAPGSALSLNGGMSIGSGYTTAVIPNANLAVQGNIGVGINTAPQGRIHTFSTSANTNHVLIETPTSGTGGA
jgi:hypothetical protein